MATRKAEPKPEAGLPAPDAKIVEKNAQAEADAQRLLGETRAAADVSSVAAEGARVQALADEQQKRREAAENENGEFEGHVYSSDNFTITTSVVLGRSLLEIKPVGWVGDGFQVSATRVAELKKLLSEVKHAPKSE